MSNDELKKAVDASAEASRQATESLDKIGDIVHQANESMKAAAPQLHAISEALGTESILEDFSDN